MRKVIIAIILFLSLRVVNAQSSFWKSLNGPSWRNLSSVVVDSINNIIYGIDQVYGNETSSFFSSSDFGQTWSHISNPGLCSLAIDSTGTVFGVTIGGIYKSSDKGKSWTLLGSFQGEFYLIYIDELQRIFAVSAYGLYLSTNNGNNWTNVNHDFGAGGSVKQIISNPINHHLFAVEGTTEVLRSTNSGITWVSCNSGISARLSNVIALSNGWLFASSDYYGGVYRSTNNGANWSNANSQLTSDMIKTMALDCRNGYIYLSIISGIARTTDNGSTWTYYNHSSTFPVFDWFMNIYTLPNGNILTSTNYDGIFKSTDYGQTWDKSNAGLVNTNVASILVTPTEAILVSDPHGLDFRSSDTGDTWVPTGFGTMTCYASSKTSVVYAINTGSGFYRSTNDGKTWQQSNDGLSSATLYSLAVDENDAIYVGGYGVIYKSTDYGISWNSSCQGITDTKVNSIVCGSNGTLFAGTNPDGVFRSTNAGLDWYQINNGLTNTKVSCIADGCNANIFAGTFGGGLFHSTDSGNNWNLLGDVLGEDTILSIISNSHGKLFLTAQSTNVYSSDDLGSTWVNVDPSETGISVLTLDPSGYLYAGTFNRGVLKSNQSTVTGIAESNYSPLDISLEQNYPNPFNLSTTIRFSISKVSFVSLKVYDLLGREVSTLLNSWKSTGIHSVNFDASRLAGGIYFYKLTTDGEVFVKKCLLIK